MVASTTFHTPRNRDAWPTIRGYVYQAELSIVRWLDLLPGEHLELECGEDIDKVFKAITADGEEQDRLLEQVKHLASVSVTLHSPQILAALANFYAHRMTNPDISLRLRFTTNTKRGRERSSPFSGEMRGLDIWEDISQESLQELPLDVSLAGIRLLLRTGSKPDIPEELWLQFQDFLKKTSDEEFCHFIQACEWSTGTTEALVLQPLIQQRLRDEYGIADGQEVEDLYARLFLYVFRLLSQDKNKMLTVEERKRQLGMPGLSTSEYTTLALLKDMHRKLEERMDVFERLQLSQNEHLTRIDQLITQLIREQEVDIAIAYTNVTPIMDLPPLVEHASQRTETVQKLRKKVEEHIWLALYGNASTGKTQLAILLVHALETRYIWIRLENTLSPEQNSIRLDAAFSTFLNGEAPQSIRSQWYRQLTDHLGRDAVIVLDDLPRLTGRDEISQRLIELTRICRIQHVRLLSTSPYRLPESILSTLGSQVVRAEAIVSLTDQEATEILQTYGIPKTLLTSVSSLNALAGRNPLLLDSMARYLQSRRWQWDQQTLTALFHRQYAVAVSEDILYRLLETVEDEQSRELLYRLNFVLGPFSYEEVRDLASVVPEVVHPRERLASLAGLWVERDADELFRISPLIRTLGNEDVALPVRLACNNVLGKRILQRKALNPDGVNEAIVYFVEARELDRAALLLIWMLSDMLRLHHPVNDAGLLSLWIESPLPQEMDLGIRLHLRGLQISLWRKWKMYVPPELVSDFEALFAQATTDQAWALLGVLIVAHNEVPNVHRALLTIFEALPQIKFPNEKQVAFSEENHLEELIWLNVIKIASIEDLHYWIRVVELLSPKQREYAFSVPAAEQGCRIVADRLWHQEADKPKKQQQWNAILEALHNLASRASRLQLELLWACAVRAQIMVLAEYSKDLQIAVTVAEAALAQSSADLRVHFLLKECLGRQYVYVHKYNEALLWLGQALNIDITSYPSERVSALLAASRASNPTNSETAVSYAEQAANLAETSPWITKLERARAYGELGIARWLAGCVEDAFPDWDRAGEHLFASKLDGDEWKNFFMLYSYVTGYMLALVTTGQPPSDMNTGELYTPPTLGFLTSYGSRTVENYRPGRESYLMIQLASFARTVVQKDRVVRWVEQALELAEKSKKTIRFEQVERNVNSTFIFPFLHDLYGKNLETALQIGAANVRIYDNLHDKTESSLNVKNYFTARLSQMPNPAETNPGKPVTELMVVGHEAVSLLVDYGQYEKAIDVALETAAATIAIMRIFSDIHDLISFELEIEGILSSKPNEAWNQVEKEAVFMSLIPIVFHIGTIALTEHDRSRVLAQNVCSYCKKIETVASNQQMWSSLVDIIDRTFVRPSSSRELNALGNQFKDELCLRAISYLGSTLQHDCRLNDALNAHGVIVPLMTRKYLGFSNTTYRNIIVPFFTTYWQLTFERKRVLFGTPRLVEAELRNALSSPVEQRVRAVLKAIALGVDGDASILKML